MIKFAEFKKLFLFNLIGSLIISALVAVVTVLIGEFNDLTSKVLLTLFMVMTHSLISLIFIWDDEKQNTFQKLSFFINVIFVLIILSFITSLFGIWKILSGSIIVNLYQNYFIICFAALHGDILSKALFKEKYINKIIFVNYLFMAIVVILLQPIIFLANAKEILGDFFFRVLGAVAIIDGTLSILTVIFYKLYLHNHPKEESHLINETQASVVTKKKKNLSIWVWILLIYLVVQITLPLILLFIKF